MAVSHGTLSWQVASQPWVRVTEHPEQSKLTTAASLTLVKNIPIESICTGGFFVDNQDSFGICDFYHHFLKVTAYSSLLYLSGWSFFTICFSLLLSLECLDSGSSMKRLSIEH